MCYRIILFLLVAATLFGCKKSDEPTLSEERTTLLLNKKWQLTSVTQDWISDTGQPVHFEHISSLADHERDNYLLYHSNNKYEINDNTIKDPDWPTAGLTGEWQLSEDGKELFMRLETPEVYPSLTWEIVVLTANELKLKMIDEGITNVNTYIAIQ